MGRLLDLGERVELVSMDPHFHDISISLYRSTGEGGASAYLAHSYSGKEGTAERLAFVMRAMADHGRHGARAGAAGPPRLRLRRRTPVGGEAALPRGLQEGAGRRGRGAAHEHLRQEERPHHRRDGDRRRAATGLQPPAARSDDKVARRVDGVTRGLIKLAEMEPARSRARPASPAARPMTSWWASCSAVRSTFALPCARRRQRRRGASSPHRARNSRPEDRERER